MSGVRVGRSYWFEYHCWENIESGDAQAWLRSHERVTVLRTVAKGWPLGTSADVVASRAANGEPRVFRVRWSDGFEWDVFEDELLDSPSDYQRPDPPS